MGCLLRTSGVSSVIIVIYQQLREPQFITLADAQLTGCRALPCAARCRAGNAALSRCWACVPAAPAAVLSSRRDFLTAGVILTSSRPRRSSGSGHEAADEAAVCGNPAAARLTPLRCNGRITSFYVTRPNIHHLPPPMREISIYQLFGAIGRTYGRAGAGRGGVGVGVWAAWRRGGDCLATRQQSGLTNELLLHKLCLLLHIVYKI